ncbi:hypothetical protein IWZ03DRAFT_33765 [Phyllosticta citriasiana]|uniref:Uncharacterized protein n=1 Tax=Phyllosticta citriasiana TaxID=595635 RepID=A0ABR1L2I6_9PEZI
MLWRALESDSLAPEKGRANGKEGLRCAHVGRWVVKLIVSFWCCHATLRHFTSTWRNHTAGQHDTLVQRYREPASRALILPLNVCLCRKGRKEEKRSTLDNQGSKSQQSVGFLQDSSPTPHHLCRARSVVWCGFSMGGLDGEREFYTQWLVGVAGARRVSKRERERERERKAHVGGQKVSEVTGVTDDSLVSTSAAPMSLLNVHVGIIHKQ